MTTYHTSYVNSMGPPTFTGSRRAHVSSSCLSSSRRVIAVAPARAVPSAAISSRSLTRPARCAATSGSSGPLQPVSQDILDFRMLSDLIASQPLDDEQRFSLEPLSVALEIPLANAKALAFKKKGLLAFTAEEIKAKIQTISTVVGVTYEQARRMAAIQSTLLLDTDRQASILDYGLKAICYELGAPREEVIDLILNNQSVLHGKELHLSVADVAHLSMLREPKGRIVD